MLMSFSSKDCLSLLCSCLGEWISKVTGIEIFDAEGNPIQVNGEADIKANPCDINLLMGYGTDPRTVDKLVDGTYFTNDDFHAWLTPFT